MLCSIMLPFPEEAQCSVDQTGESSQRCAVCAHGTIALHLPDILLRGCTQTFWHSSAHVLGEALESCFGAKLTIGPALEEGFYYDCFLGERTLTEADKAALEKRIQEVWCALESV